jgi:hypothetical protein
MGREWIGAESSRWRRVNSAAAWTQKKSHNLTVMN